MTTLLLAASASTGAEVIAVRLTTLDDRTSLRILTAEAPGRVEAQREGDEVVIVLAADAPEGLALPDPIPPVEAIRLERDTGRTTLRVQVAPEVPFEVRREEAVLTVVFGERSLAERVPAAELYEKLFPEEVAKPDDAQADNPRQDGVWVGSIRLRPALLLSYVDADVASETGQPVRERYFEIQPTLGANLGVSLWGGRIKASYEPRFRTFTTLPSLNETSHFVNASIDLTVAQRLDLKGSYHYARGVLETQEVDPGREYFFPLGHFRHEAYGAGARFEMTPRVSLESSATWNRIHVDQPAGFTGYDQDAFRAGLAYEASANTHLSAGYERLRVPPAPDRPVVEADADSVFVGIRTERGPALSGQAEVAWRRQTNPQAAPPGESFSGLNYSATLRRAVGVNAAVDVGGGRSTQVSGFEENGFYVSNFLGGGLTVNLPWELALRGGVNWTWNRYRLPASGVGEPRQDDLFGWSIGTGRPFGRRAFLRADYRWDRRDSNIPGYSMDSHGFIIQLGVGFFPERSAQ